MIAGTEFNFDDPQVIAQACLEKRPGDMTVSEIDDLMAECDAGRAACLTCEDGLLVISGEAHNGGGIEMFVLLAVAFKHGAVERQDAALQIIARDLGARTIAFRARRKGWARRLGPEWQRRGTDEFVRAV
jgi:hypothetical protein